MSENEKKREMVSIKGSCKKGQEQGTIRCELGTHGHSGNVLTADFYCNNLWEEKNGTHICIGNGIVYQDGIEITCANLENKIEKQEEIIQKQKERIQKLQNEFDNYYQAQL